MSTPKSPTPCSRWELDSIYLAAKTHAVVRDGEAFWLRGRPFIACGREPRLVGAIYATTGTVECLGCLRWLNRMRLPHELRRPEIDLGSPPRR